MDDERVGTEAASTAPGQKHQLNKSINSIPSDKNSLIENFSFDSKDKKIFLQRLPGESEISIISGAFHVIARSNKTVTPSQLFDLVISKLFKKHPRTIQYLNSHKDEALDFATYVLEKVNLPEEDQRLIREKQDKKYEKEATAAKPPTLAQLKFLDKLGFTGPIQNRQEAIETISELVGENK